VPVWGDHEDTTRAVDRSVVETICTRRDIDLRERLLWRMLYETASRATAVLELNVKDLDLDNRRARIRVKGGDTGWITWGRGTAILLPRYLRGRQAPLFCSERRPGPARRATTPARDLCPETGRMRQGYDRARTLIKHHTGLELHQLRHSAATHLGDDAGVDVTVIMAKTHHRSIRTAARYTGPGLAAVTAATEHVEPPRRRS